MPSTYLYLGTGILALIVFSRILRQLPQSRSALCATRNFAALLVGCLLSIAPAQAINLEVRLMCDTTGTCNAGDFFYDNPEALDTLNFVARAFEPFTDQLSAVTVPTATFLDPDSVSSNFSISNLIVPAETLIVYAGGHNLIENRVGQAGPGAPLNVFDRGQGIVSGLGAVDFAPWGGAIAFDTTTSSGSPRNWHFDYQSDPAPGHVDFLSVAVHELGHLFGFGLSDSFSNQIVGLNFTGPESVALVGGGVPLADLHHWGDAVTSPPYENPRQVAFGRSLTVGRRTTLSPLDYAALDDLGWEVPAQLLGLHGNSDGDQDVDGHDFLAWQRGNGSSDVGALQGDLNGDTVVDDYDLWLWSQNHGAQSAVSGATTGIAVPEPSSLCLLVLVTSVWIAARRGV